MVFDVQYKDFMPNIGALRKGLTGVLGGGYEGRDQLLTFYNLAEGSTIADLLISIPPGTDP